MSSLRDSKGGRVLGTLKGTSGSAKEKNGFLSYMGSSLI